MRKLDYVPNQAARNLAFGGTRSGENNRASSANEGARTKASISLCFEGDWSYEEQVIIERTIRCTRKERTSWLCVKTQLRGAPLFVAKQLEEPYRWEKSNSAQALARQLRS